MKCYVDRCSVVSIFPEVRGSRLGAITGILGEYRDTGRVVKEFTSGVLRSFSINVVLWRDIGII